ncbi:MAG: NUDIX domain-containing protein [bacterium]
MTDLSKDIQACVGVMIFKDGKVLLGKRCGKHAPGEYSFPGGRIEYMESFLDAVKRETLEEAGVKIKNIKFLNVANINRYSYRHDISTHFTADWESGEPQEFPEERIKEWNWYSLDNLPSPIFYPTQIVVDSYKSGINFYDKE